MTGVEGGLKLRVKEMSWEAEGVLGLGLQHVLGRPLPQWEPGAHISLHLAAGLARQYSLCGDPDDRRTWRVAVLREQAGRGGSRYVHERLRPGDIVEAGGPRNHFALEDAGRYLFIAGGIGITPLLPMIRKLAAEGADWTLYYGGRSRSSMGFLEDLEIYGSRVTVHPQDEHGLLDLEAIVGTPQPGTSVYCCGPEPLLDAVGRHMERWPSGSHHFERFSPVQVTGPARAEEPFELVLARRGLSLEVPPGLSVLDALEKEGVEADYSCREGICGTCETAVLSGTPDHRDSLLSEAERESNDTMMICVGRALSAQLVLDL